MAKGCSLYLPFFPLLRLSFSVLLLLSFSSYASRFCPLFFPSFSLFPIPLLFLHVPHLVCFARDFSWNLKFFVVRSQSSLLGGRFFIPVYERFNFFSSFCLCLYLPFLFFSLFPLSFRLPEPLHVSLPLFVRFYYTGTFVIFICLLEI